MVARQALQFGDQFGPIARSKVCLSPSFQRRQMPLRKLVGYAGHGELIAQVAYRIPVPQRQGFAEYRGRSGGVLG